MVSTFISLLDIQSWWEIPCIAHFCSLFSSAFNLPDIDIEDLESALLTDETDESVGLLPELIVHLLKGCDKLRKFRDKITTSNYQMFLRRFLRHQCRLHKIENYFDSDIDFQSLPLRNKLLILHSLCHFRLDSKDVQDILSNLEADSLRVEPLGYDSKNSGYWYFYGTRLYREDTKSNGKTIWQVICFTEEDWQNLAGKFKNSTSPKERALYNILVENFLPKLPQLFRERERLRRRKLLQVRNSARIRNHLEEKQKQASAELAEKQQIEEKLKIEAAQATTNKYKSSRIRRRSQSSSTASGISTYASSFRCAAASSDSAEFLVQREKFCLSPEDDVFLSSSPSSPSPEPSSFNTNGGRYHINLKIKNNVKVKLNESSFPTLEKKKSTKKRRHPKESQESGLVLNDSLEEREISDDDDDNVDDNSALIKEEDKENCFIDSDSDNCSIKSSTVATTEKLSSGLESKILEMAPTTNMKLPGRQTNNSLSSLAGNIFIPTSVFGNTSGATGGASGKEVKGNIIENSELNNSGSSSNNKNKEKIHTSTSGNSDNSQQKKSKKSKSSAEIFTETDEVLQIGMHKVLVYVKNHRDAWPFMDPVEEDIAPRYYSIIRRPMDLLKMEEKLDNGEYTKFSEFRNDFKLIVNNCRLYNGQDNEYTQMVNNLQEAFEKATKKYFDHYSSDEEGNLCYPDSKTNVFREKHFNKNNSTKSNQKDVTTDKKEKGSSSSSSSSKGKGKNEKSTIDTESNSKNEKNNDKNNDNSKGGTKRKRKDKDKRRKKKLKLKSNSIVHENSSNNEDNDDDDDDDDNDNDDNDGDNNVNHKNSVQQIKKEDSDGDNGHDDEENYKKEEEEVKRKTKSRKERDTTSSLSSSNKKPSKEKSLSSSNKRVGAAVGGKNQKGTQSRSLTKSSISKKIQQEEKFVNNTGSSSGSKKSNSNNKSSSKGGKFLSSSKKESKLMRSEAEDIPTDEDIRDDFGKKSDNDNDDVLPIGVDHKKEKHSSGGNKKLEKHSSTNTMGSNNSSNNKTTKQEKENQNTKSKFGVNKESKKDSTSSSSSHLKDNNKPRSNTNSKKKKNKSNKKIETTSEKLQQQQQHQQENTQYDDDGNEDDNNSLSRSPSPLYKVDLHKKYAKSASFNFEDELLFSSPKSTTENHHHTKKHHHHHYHSINTTTTKKSNNKNDRDGALVTNRILSRSPSPLNHIKGSMDTVNEKKEKKKKISGNGTVVAGSSSSKKNEKRKKSSVAATKSRRESLSSSPLPPAPLSSSSSPNKLQQQQTVESDPKEISPFLDKYDLIKQRRSRNATRAAASTPTTDEKWNQIVKEAEKIKDTKKNTSKVSTNTSALTTAKEKNQKLKETIEKLKVKNAKSKERSVLIDQIFGVKPIQEIRDEQTIFQKLRETCLDAKPTTATTSAAANSGSNKKLSALSTSTVKESSSTHHHHRRNKGSPNEYDFSDDLIVASSITTTTATKSSSSSNKKKEREKPNTSSGGRKKSAVKTTSSTSSLTNTVNTKTNIEALELETEQTLKDINRWLEHTPRFSEFSSASNSPSRYNLLDDFDAVASKLDPNDFRRPVPITVPAAKVDTSAATETAVPKLSDTFHEFTNNICAEGKRDDISSLITAASVVNAESSSNNNATLVSSSTTTTTSTIQNAKSKEATNTTQLLPHPPPPPPHVKSQQQKEAKRKSLKEKLQAVVVGNKRKDPLRTIDRLQPGKSKGNLISNIHNNKTDEIFPLGASAKIKEVKNSLLVKTDETTPKLSLGSVLNTEGFGLGQLHSFETDSASSTSLKISDVISGGSSSDKSEKKEDGNVSEDTPEKIEDSELGMVVKDNISSLISEKKNETKPEKLSATPNLSAWFKAFGAPKKAKKLEEEEKKSESLERIQSDSSPEKITEVVSLSTTISATTIPSTFNILKSPPTTVENFPLPAPRTSRKASTGSTISERSSFSQDPDSPRVGIDDRFSSFSGPYASPIGASPIMVSPKPDEIGKPTSPYPLNGAIKVGFYQDTTTKSSPEKSCSPRELPSPYPQYSQHVYTSASSPTIGSSDIGGSGGGAAVSYGTSCYNNSNSSDGSGAGGSDINKVASATTTPVYPSASSVTLYEQYKQPHSHESDYNSSMSPSTNPSSPYQQSSQNSPYQQHQNSPYQQSQNSPYHQSQNSPFQGQTTTPSGASPMVTNKSPVNQQQSPQGPHSPYQQSINSPYQQSNSSPYNQQNASSPYHTQQPQPTAPPPQSQQPQMQSQIQQQQVNMNFNQQHTSKQVDSPQQPPSDSPFSQESPQYQIHDSPQYQQQQPDHQQPNPQSVFAPEMVKDPVKNRSNLAGPEWGDPHSHMNMSNSNPQSNSGTSLTELSPMVSPHHNSQQQQQQQMRVQQQIHHQQHQDNNNANLQYHQAYPQYPITTANKVSTGGSMIQQHQDHSQQSSGIKRAAQQNESEVLSLSGFAESQPPPNKTQKCDSEKPFDSTLNKHQQMFDSFLGSMGGGGGKTNLGFGRPPLEISTSKAFEMFNRAATYGTSKEFQQNNLLNSNSAGVNKMDTTMGNNIQTQQAPQQQQQLPKPPQNNSAIGGKSILNSNFNQEQLLHHQAQQQHQQSLEETSKLQSFHHNPLSDPSETGKLHHQQQSALGSTYSNPNLVHPPSVMTDKMPNDLVIPSNPPPPPRQDQLVIDATRNQTLNMEYKQTYNNPAAMLDPLRNLNHPLSMLDENMLNLQNVPSTGYYDKNIPPAAHVFSKNLSQQSYHQNSSPYDARDQQSSVPGAYIPSSMVTNNNTNLPQQQQIQDGIDPKTLKRVRKKKGSTPTPIDGTVAAVNNQNRNSMMSTTVQPNQCQPPPSAAPSIQSQVLPPNAVVTQNIHDQQQQGFQLYAGLKTVSTSAATDSSAISLKSTAASMVPGSAFNFGPSPTGLGLSPGIYGDNSGYLDEFRGAHNPYYAIPPGHRPPPEMGNEKSPNAPPPPGPSPTTYHQFLTHSSSRTSYPFMNSPQLDPNSPIYQQYIQRQEELRARMMLNQGLLGPGPAPGYPQPGYRPPIGMPKHYDMNRQPWF